MRRLFWLVLLFAPAHSQDSPAAANPPNELARAAASTGARWQELASTLDARTSRMLPCDPRLRTAIEEASRASEARLAALRDYLQAEQAQAQRDSDAARAAMEAEQAAAREDEIDRAEAEQERIAVEGQLADLTDSVKRQPPLEEARQKLESIAAMVRARAAGFQQQSGRRSALLTALGEVASAQQIRQKSIDAELAALRQEATRWSDYYAAHLARAHTECTITGQAPAARPAQRKKQ